MTKFVENSRTSHDNSSTTLGGNGTITPGIDSNHPYFLTHSDAPGMNLINNTFDGKGDQAWKGSVLIALSAKNKLGSSAAGSPDLQPWSRCNDMATSRLLNSLSREIADSVIYSRSAREHWISLEHPFGQSNGAKLFYQ
ncbi:hypothetical protein KY289_000600 [Solanum tuberosum]|nr:hypothetical protein KY289_000600 [Solanum tuberosum]